MKKNVIVTFDIEVTVDESKFTPEFIEVFKRWFGDFDTIEEHVVYIAELAAKGCLDDLTEGYGDLKSMGIKAKVNDLYAEIEGTS